MPSGDLIDRLRRRWWHYTGACKNETGADNAFDGIVAAYSEPHRAYHTLEHLDFLFARLDEHAADVKEPGRLQFAAWYHDIVYDPASKQNEELSAQRAESELLGLGMKKDHVARVARLIRATASHAKGGADEQDNLFLDADFCILGAAPEIYARYIANVRREYAHVDDAGWRNGRGAFLALALGEPRLFRTDLFERAYGGQARANIRDELQTLNGAAY